MATQTDAPVEQRIINVLRHGKAPMPTMASVRAWGGVEADPGRIGTVLASAFAARAGRYESRLRSGLAYWRGSIHS